MVLIISVQVRIIAFMNSYSHGKSGGDMVFIEIAKRIKNYGFLVVTSLLGKKLCNENNLKVDYFITSQESEFRNVIWIYFTRIVKVLFADLHIQKNDLLLGTSDFLPDVLPILFQKLRCKENKWIQHIFHLIPSSRKIPYFTQKISLFLIRKGADIIIVDNALLKKELEECRFDPQKIVINYPGIDLAYLHSVKGNHKKYDGVFMAQLRQSKGVFDLIKIWTLVCQREPNARLAIIGQGESQIISKIKLEISSNHLKKNIDFLGFLKNEEAYAIMKSSKVFVFPSHEEGFGIAALEAQALGLPVVAWNLPVFSEIFPKGMIKIKIAKINEFANEVKKLITHVEIINKLSKDAVTNAYKYQWNKSAQREVDLINRISN